jgi:hypothetical protein
VVTDQFTCTNLPSDKQAEVLTEELPVTIFGASTDVAAVTGADIKVVADLSSYSSASGTYTVPAVVEIGSDHDVGVSGTYHVRVTIREQTADTDADTEEPQEPETEE